MTRYGLYALVLILRNVSATYQGLHDQELLLTHGLEPWPVPGPIGMAIRLGTLLLLIGGTAATLWFGRQSNTTIVKNALTAVPNRPLQFYRYVSPADPNWSNPSENSIRAPAGSTKNPTQMSRLSTWYGSI